MGQRGSDIPNPRRATGVDQFTKGSRNNMGVQGARTWLASVVVGPGPSTLS